MSELEKRALVMGVLADIGFDGQVAGDTVLRVLERKFAIAMFEDILEGFPRDHGDWHIMNGMIHCLVYVVMTKDDVTWPYALHQVAECAPFATQVRAYVHTSVTAAAGAGIIRSSEKRDFPTTDKLREVAEFIRDQMVLRYRSFLMPTGAQPAQA